MEQLQNLHNTQYTLTFYWNWILRQQISHCHILWFRQWHTGLLSRSPLYTNFSTIPSVGYIIGFRQTSDCLLKWKMRCYFVIFVYPHWKINQCYEYHSSCNCSPGIDYQGRDIVKQGQLILESTDEAYIETYNGAYNRAIQSISRIEI